MVTTTSDLSLVADVGGTNTRVALADGPALQHASIRKFRNSDHSGLDDVLATYLQETEASCTGAAVAIAGPVHQGKGHLTNLNWSADHQMLARVTGAERLSVVNDLQAQAHALGHIAPGNLTRVVRKTKASGQTPLLVIGFGTGSERRPGP